MRLAAIAFVVAILLSNIAIGLGSATGAQALIVEDVTKDVGCTVSEGGVGFVPKATVDVPCPEGSVLAPSIVPIGWAIQRNIRYALYTGNAEVDSKSWSMLTEEHRKSVLEVDTALAEPMSCQPASGLSKTQTIWTPQGTAAFTVYYDRYWSCDYAIISTSVWTYGNYNLWWRYVHYGFETRSAGCPKLSTSATYRSFYNFTSNSANWYTVEIINQGGLYGCEMAGGTSYSNSVTIP